MTEISHAPENTPNFSRKTEDPHVKRLAETYARAAQQCGVTLWTFDLASRTVYDLSNASHSKAFDRTDVICNVPEVFTSEGSLLHPDDLPAFLAMFDEIFAGAEMAKSVGRWWNEDRKAWWWYEICHTSIFDEDGKPFQAIGTAIDITERVRLEARYNEEIEWRKVHNQDVLGSFKMNLTKNICDDGQSDDPAILDFQADGTVDGFFDRECSTHIGTADLETYRQLFSRPALLKSFHEGKSSVVHEAYVRLGDHSNSWIKVEVDMFQNPKTDDIEAYIYAIDIDREKTAHALVDAVVSMDYDYLALLDTITGNYTIFAKAEGKTPLPP
ncbi:MAG: hypothetical protein RR295_09700, partial [Oscillospiraceae bacterium]